MGGLIYSHQGYMEAVEAVTIADVVSCANKMQLHSTYFLKGGSQ